MTETKKCDSKEKKHFSEEDRNAMRAFLQRAEVRLSTIHRVAGVFLNGAGLLLLFPVFLKEALNEIMKFFLKFWGFIQFDSSLENLNILLKLFLYISTLSPFFLSIAIPIYALYLLLKDIIHFYFIGYTPGFKPKYFIPRFVLSGVVFPKDEPDGSQELKNEIFKKQYKKRDSLESDSNWIHFLLPFREAERNYYKKINENTEGAVIPETRQFSKLKELFDYNEKELLEESDVRDFNVGLGLAGVIDRDLVEEVAKMEVSLARHNFSLRRLVLRYAKALLMFIWTTLISFILISILTFFNNSSATNTVASGKITFFVVTVVYLFWLTLAPILLRRPIKWIYEHTTSQNIEKVTRDDQLLKFEKFVKFLCNSSAIILIIAIFLAWITSSIH